MNPNSRNQVKVKKAGEKITEKTYRKSGNQLINERRKVEVFPVNKPQTNKDKETIQSERRNLGDIKLREPRRKEVSRTDSYGLRKEAEKITERIIPGRDHNLYLERRKVEVFRDLSYKGKSKYEISNQRREQITSKRRFQEELLLITFLSQDTQISIKRVDLLLN